MRFDHWRSQSLVLARHDSLNEVVEAMRELPRKDSNQYWAELLDLAHTGDDLARRVMLQVLVPFFERETSRWLTAATSGTATRAEIEQLVYSAGLQALAKLEQRSGPLEWPVLDVVRETRRVVKSMVRSDELWASTTVALTEVTSRADQDCDRRISPALLDRSPQQNAADGLGKVLVELVEAEKITQAAARLVWATRTGLCSFDEIAEAEGTTFDTLRRRRHRTEKAISGAFADAA